MAFAAALAIGVAADLPATTIMWRALVAMAVCWVVGRVIGWIAFRALQIEIETYKNNHPVRPASEEGKATAAPSSPPVERATT
ncbi:MAG: hypothetical protein K8S99_15145 [Planctomycetes bacterium]|nr:hypothetical protein [Planctomycetota bacterium]